ncbi:FAD-dependent oxidoreductase, partial [Oligoflexia bacterium]|nr:FAD-dependent oxidoreductase [Oligoflexia bacterium]
FEKDSISWGPNNTFHFPKHGGTGAIWNAVAKIVGEDKFQLNTALTEVSSARKEAKLSDGTTVQFENILSTIPLNLFTTMVEEVGPDLKQKANGLKYSSANIIGIGLKGRPKSDLATKCWMYFPEDNCPFYRVTLFSNYSSFNVPDSDVYFSLMAEVSESPKKAVDRDNVIADTIEGLLNTTLIDKTHEIVSTWSYFAPYGYPIPSLERDHILTEVIPTLDKMQMYSRGRFGGWKYEVSNQDHSFMQGVEWVNWITAGEKESTFNV